MKAQSTVRRMASAQVVNTMASGQTAQCRGRPASRSSRSPRQRARYQGTCATNIAMQMIIVVWMKRACSQLTGCCGLSKVVPPWADSISGNVNSAPAITAYQ